MSELDMHPTRENMQSLQQSENLFETESQIARNITTLIDAKLSTNVDELKQISKEMQNALMFLKEDNDKLRDQLSQAAEVDEVESLNKQPSKEKLKYSSPELKTPKLS